VTSYLFARLAALAGNKHNTTIYTYGRRLQDIVVEEFIQQAANQRSTINVVSLIVVSGVRLADVVALENVGPKLQNLLTRNDFLVYE
jgi:uncharacterized membrane protein